MFCRPRPNVYHTGYAKVQSHPVLISPPILVIIIIYIIKTRFMCVCVCPVCIEGGVPNLRDVTVPDFQVPKRWDEMLW